MFWRECVLFVTAWRESVRQEFDSRCRPSGGSEVAFLSPLRGWSISRFQTHGSRRGLHSGAASRLESTAERCWFSRGLFLLHIRLARGQAVYFGNVAAGKFHDCAGAAARGVRCRQDFYPCGFCPIERRAEMLHLISGQFVAKWIRQMTIRHQDLQVAEQGRDLYASVGFSGASDSAGVRMPVIGNHSAVGEAQEATNKIIGLVARYVDPVVWNGFKRRIFGWQIGRASCR